MANVRTVDVQPKKRQNLQHPFADIPDVWRCDNERKRREMNESCEKGATRRRRRRRRKGAKGRGEVLARISCSSHKRDRDNLELVSVSPSLVFPFLREKLFCPFHEVPQTMASDKKLFWTMKLFLLFFTSSKTGS